MESTVTATELARKLGDFLARARYRGESFLVEKNGVPIARLVPIAGRRGATVATALAAWGAGPYDPTFADDLERVKRVDKPPTNPWA